MGGTTGGGVSFVWGLLTLMLIELLALAGVAWAVAVVLTGAGSAGAVLTAGLMVTGEADLTKGGAGADVDGGASWAFVTVVDLLGASFMGGTFMDDIITAGGGGEIAGTVFTTTVALDLAGSMKNKKRQEAT